MSSSTPQATVSPASVGDAAKESADEKLAREFGSMVTDISEGGSDAGGEEALLDSVAEAAEAEAEAAEAEVDTENQGDFPLDAKLVPHYLADFGRASSGSACGYLSFVHPEGTGLTSVDCLAGYTLLQKVDVRANALKSLTTALGSMPDLIEVNASQNQLSECLDFNAPRNLRRVILSHNLISSIGNQASNRYLQSLVLDNNQISNIAGLSECKQLTHLSLKHNQLQSITGLENLPLKTLHLDHNKITSTAGLETLKYLRSLDLSFNNISVLTGLAPLTVLSDLNLSANGVAFADDVLELKDLKFLVELNLDANPVQEIMDYRLALIFRLQRLTSLDTEVLAPEEKVASVHLFDPPLDVVAAINHVMHTTKHIFVEPDVRQSTTAGADTPYPALVLTGPSGSGKRVLRNKLVSSNKNFAVCPTHTTRPQADHEVDGEDYIFVTEDDFADQVDQGQFWQTCRIHGHMFGLSTLAFEKVASDRQIPVICVEVEAVKTLKKTHMQPSYVYCRPPKEWLNDYPERRDVYEGLANTEGFFDHTIDGEAVDDLYNALLPIANEVQLRRTEAWSDEQRRYN